MIASQRRVSDALDALTVAVEDEALPTGVVWSLGYLRAWMEERIVSDRQTGATDFQIEAAAKRWYAETYNRDSDMPWEMRPHEYQQHQADYYRVAAHRLVPPTHRIVAADDLRAVIKYADDRIPDYSMDKANEAVLDRLREVLGE